MLGHVYHHINVHRRNKPFAGSQAGDAMASQWAASWVGEVSIQCVSGFRAVLPRSIVDSSGGLDMWMWGTLYPCIQLPRSPGWRFGHVCRSHFLRKMMWCVFDLEAFFPRLFFGWTIRPMLFSPASVYVIGAPINVIFIPLCQDVPVCRATVDVSKGCTRIADLDWPISMAGCHDISLPRWSYITWFAPMAQGGPSRVLHRMLCTVLLHMEGLQHENGCAFGWLQSNKSRPMDQFVVALCWTTGPKSGSRISTTFGYENGGHFDVWHRE